MCQNTEINCISMLQLYKNLISKEWKHLGAYVV